MSSMLIIDNLTGVTWSVDAATKMQTFVSQNAAVVPAVPTPGYRAPSVGIDPDALASGPDVMRLQAAFDLALATNGSINLGRIYDITGGSVVLSRSGRRHIYIRGGGVRKTDAGPMFTAATTDAGDVSFHGVKFLSSVGAGTVVFDCSKLIQITSIDCAYRDVDSVALATGSRRYFQSMRFIGDTIVGGTGYAFDCEAAYDSTWDNVLVEFRDGGIRQSTVLNMLMSGVRIRDCVFESLTFNALLLGHAGGLVIDGCYFEVNGGNIEWRSDAILQGVQVSNNRVSQLVAGESLIKWGMRPASCLSSSNWTEHGAVHDTTNQQSVDFSIKSVSDRSGDGTPNIVGTFDPIALLA